ncbi:MAG: endonuclease domain-containing protein [Acidimicrobiales bacterium]
MTAHDRFDPDSVDTFRVVGRSFDAASRTVSLEYGLGDSIPFLETVTFETPTTGAVDTDAPGFQRALLHLHIAAGTSYYKAAAPPLVSVEGEALDPAEEEFHRHLYDDGLREFAVANGRPVPRSVSVHPEHGRERRPPMAGTDRPGGLLVPIGGGKDSMVLIEAVRHLRPTLFAVNPHPLVLELADRTGLDLVVVRRTLSPRLAELNRSGALNGHVPITAIISLIAVVGSFLYGYDAIAMAVERSASEETVLVGGVPVNHQYSKSLEFEHLLGNLVHGSVDPALSYGSALRPYSELSIARAFSTLGSYHDGFCSCNTAFRQSAAPGDRWCGACPKCRFVGLMLAPFLSPEAVTAIIGRDMFDEPDQIAGFAALMSHADKPFECVGERRESAAAMRLLSGQPGWRDKVVVAALGAAARAMVTGDDIQGLLTPDPRLAFDRPDVARAVDSLLSAVP